MRMRSVLAVAVMAACLAIALEARAEQRYMRYRLLEPKAASRASLRVISHAKTPEIHYSWTGVPLKGTIARMGFYVPPGQWSDWHRLPDPPVWGTFYVDFTVTGDKKDSVKAEIQIAEQPDEKTLARQITAAGGTGTSVGFILPKSILKDPKQIESVEDALNRRLAVGKSMAVPVEKYPKLLHFSPSGVRGDPTIADGQKREEEVLRVLGINTFGIRTDDPPTPGEYFGMGGNIDGDKDIARVAAFAGRIKAHFGPQVLKRIAYNIIYDEPGTHVGFRNMWPREGEKGFRAFLKKNGVPPECFGAKGYDQIDLIKRDEKVDVDAFVERRRLKYWSWRYAQRLNGEFFAGVRRKVNQVLPGVPATFNFPVHHITLGGGMCAGVGLDYFEMGRCDALDMYWQEDWISSGLTGWANGMYQKAAYLTEFLRAAARYHNVDKLGYHVICIGYAPLDKGINNSVSARVNMLLGRGVKTFSFFNYGPTSRGTIDFWSDHAPTIRGVADAIQLCGGDAVEPFLFEGEVPASEACMILCPTADIWQTVNGRASDGREKVDLYCMLSQENVPVDTIDSSDLDRFIKGYKVAYFVDMNMERRSAAALAEWVKQGGVLCLWPGAASRDEYNEPLDVFPVAAGEQPLGKGTLIRFADRPADIWWKKTLEMNRQKRYWWACLFDTEQRERVSEPALGKAGVNRPVVTDGTAVVANVLISEKGVAVPLVNLQGMRAEGAIPCPNLTVTLRDGKDLVRAYSARKGDLEIRRDGDAISVVLPLLCTDIVVFSREAK